ncbi:MAG: hypothetical protein DRI34_10835 [Deltaproteobacteria bacterium]|nr:MAG: hypothetical protein DRI34_10835 [Deltaproteobacteria bacterium]
MKRTASTVLLVLLLGCAGPAGAAGHDYPVLREVLRHLRLMFVDQPNLNALLLGGLRGLKQSLPELRVELGPRAGQYFLRAGASKLATDARAVESFTGLERALLGALRLARAAGGKKGMEHQLIRGLISHCGDRWTVFLESAYYRRLLDDGTRQLGSVGLLPAAGRGGLLVLDVRDGSPAGQAGIRPGQVIDSIAGQPSERLNELEALALLRGPLGQKVTVTVAGRKHRLAYASEPKRNISVDPPEQGIARVHLLNFRAGTARRLRAVLGKLENMGMRGLVLDLRGNPGGLLTEGVAVAGLFMDAGPVVRVVGRGRRHGETSENPAPGSWRALPLVLLVDGRSASVSEMVTMVLHERRGAKIVGSTTLGKGVVQVLIELEDGSALKLSTARYATPAGRTLLAGIEPDVPVAAGPGSGDLALQAARRVLSGR